MTQSPNPNNRRRRLTADELIAIMVSMAGIGTIFWWSISQRPAGWNLANTAATGTARSASSLPVAVDGVAAGTQVILGTAKNNAVADENLVIATPTAGSAGNSSKNSSTVDTDSTPSVSAIAGLSTPLVTYDTSPAPAVSSPLPSSTAPAFKDVEQYWAKDYVAVLRQRGVLDDFGSGTFEPNLPVTRGEYAKMLDRAFDKPVTQQVLEFQDIPATYTRRAALDKSVKMGFMTGYSKTLFKPEEKIPRYQMQISLAKGLGLKAVGAIDSILAKYPDAKDMPKYAREKMAAAIESGFVVKDSNANLLQPNNATTRGEAAALIYGALVKEGKIQPVK
jgi:hypothetical protein